MVIGSALIASPCNLCMDGSAEFCRQSGRVVEMSLTIEDQKHGKHFTKRIPGTALIRGYLCTMKLLLSPFLQLILRFVVGDGLTSFHTRHSGTRPGAILLDRAVLSRPISLSLDHPIMSSLIMTELCFCVVDPTPYYLYQLKKRRALHIQFPNKHM